MLLKITVMVSKEMKLALLGKFEAFWKTAVYP